MHGGSNEVKGECLRGKALSSQLYLRIHAQSAHCGAEHHWLDQADAHSSPQMLDSPEIHHVRPLVLGGCYTCLELGQQCRDHLEEKGVNIQKGGSYIPSRVAFLPSQHEYSKLNSCSEKVKSRAKHCARSHFCLLYYKKTPTTPWKNPAAIAS